MRLCVLAVVALISIRTAAAECKKASGKPIYTMKHGPLAGEPGEPPPTPTEIFQLYASGRWTYVTTDEPGETAPAGGCITPAALREVTRALARATFRHPREPVAVCAAVPHARITYAAPRRGKVLSIESPCGTPPDATTSALIACVESARSTSTSLADLRTTCRGR